MSWLARRDDTNLPVERTRTSTQLSGQPDASSPPAGRRGDFLIFSYDPILDYLNRLMIGGICECVKAAVRIPYTAETSSVCFIICGLPGSVELPKTAARDSLGAISLISSSCYRLPQEKGWISSDVSSRPTQADAGANRLVPKAPARRLRDESFSLDR